MRRLIWHFLFVFGCVSLAQGEIVHVTTWNLNWFPSGSPDILPPEEEAQRISAVGEVLKEIAPDIIVLQEVRDWDSCEQLVQHLGGDPYKVLICSNFKDVRSDAPGKRQLAILSKLPVESSWSQGWRGKGSVKPPGGYVFAAVSAGSATLGIFGVHFKNNLIQGNTERETQLNILKRELSAEQLIEDIEQLQDNPRERADALIIAGNLNTSSEQNTFISEKTLNILRAGEFSSGFEDTPLDARITAPGRNRYPDATFDYVFVRNAGLNHPPVITSSKVSDHFPVTRQLVIDPRPLLSAVDQAAGASTANLSETPASTNPTEAPPTTNPLDTLSSPLAAVDQAVGAPIAIAPSSNSWMWAAPFLLLTVATVWLATRPRTAPAVVMRVPGGIMSLEDVRAPLTPGPQIDPGVWQARTAQAERRANEATAMVRAGLIPHLARLMADKLVRKLLWQRTHLVENQRITAAHVAELEQRLGQLQPKLQSRLDAYEKRIAELEHELEEHRRGATSTPEATVKLN